MEIMHPVVIELETPSSLELFKSALLYSKPTALSRGSKVMFLRSLGKNHQVLWKIRYSVNKCTCGYPGVWSKMTMERMDRGMPAVA